MLGHLCVLHKVSVSSGLRPDSREVRVTQWLCHMSLLFETVAIQREHQASQ